MNDYKKSEKATVLSVMSLEEIEKVKLQNFNALLPDQRLEYSVSQLEIKLNTLISQVNSISVYLGSQINPVNWLKGWPAYRFANTYTDLQILDIKNRLIAYALNELNIVDTQMGTAHTASFNWVEDLPYTYRLEAYLNPSAVLVPGPGGGGSGIVNPRTPPPPPPNGF